MSELASTYQLLLSDATKEATYNRIAETEATPQTILGDADGTLVIGVLKKDGIYHFYPVRSSQTIYASNNRSDGDSASGDGGTTLLYWILGILVLFIISSKKRAT